MARSNLGIISSGTPDTELEAHAQRDDLVPEIKGTNTSLVRH